MVSTSSLQAHCLEDILNSLKLSPSCNTDLPDSLYPSPHLPPFGSEGSPSLFTFKILELILFYLSSTHKANFHCPLQKSSQCLCIFFHPAASTSEKLATNIYKALSLLDFTSLFPIPALLERHQFTSKPAKIRKFSCLFSKGLLDSIYWLDRAQIQRNEYWCDTAPKLMWLHRFQMVSEDTLNY